MSKTRSNADMANKLAFDSIAAMESFAAAENNNVAIVKGSQGGTFIYDSTKSTINDKVIIFKGWVRQYYGAINLKWGGDTSLESTWVAVSALSDDIEIDSGSYTLSTGNVDFYSKNFFTTGAVSISGNTTIKVRDNSDDNKRRKIFASLPAKFQHYNQVIADNPGSAAYYPQGLLMHKDTGSFYVSYSSDLGINSKVFIVRYDISTKLETGSGYAGGGWLEGFAIVGTDLYGRSEQGAIASKIGKYNLNGFAWDGTDIPLTQEYDIGMYSQMSYEDGIFYIEKGIGSFYGSLRRGEILKYDASFNKIGQFEILGNYNNKMKRQSFAMANGIFIGGYGNNHDGEEGLTGIVKFSQNGINIYSNLAFVSDFKARMNTIEKEGLTSASIASNQGVAAYDNKIYSIFLLNSATTNGAYNYIFEEEANDATATSFEDINNYDYSVTNHEIYIPKTTHNLRMFDDISGIELTSVEDICDFLVRADIYKFMFYTSIFNNINDLNSIPLLAHTHVTIWIGNTSTMYMKVEGGINNDLYKITGLAGARIQTLEAPRVKYEFYPATDGTQRLGSSGKNWSAIYANNYFVETKVGVSGNFTTADNKTITVTKGIITGIV